MTIRCDEISLRCDFDNMKTSRGRASAHLAGTLPAVPRHRGVGLPTLDQAAMLAIRDAWFEQAGGAPPGNKCECVCCYIPSPWAGLFLWQHMHVFLPLGLLPLQTCMCASYVSDSAVHLYVSDCAQVACVACAHELVADCSIKLLDQAMFLMCDDSSLCAAVQLERQLWQSPVDAGAISARGKRAAAEDLARQLVAGAAALTPLV